MTNIPSYPSGAPVPPDRPNAPPPVLNAVKLMYAGAVLSALGLIFVLATKSRIKRDIINANPNSSLSSDNRAVNIVIVGAVIGGLIGIGLWIWMAAMNRRGHSWARITGTVFFGINTLGLIGLTQHTTALSKIVTVLTWLVGLAAVILLWRPESSAFFNTPQYPDYPPPGFPPSGFQPPNYPPPYQPGPS